MENRQIIWDFNGTLFDDLHACFNTINIMLKERGLSPLLSVDEYRHVFGFPIIEYYKRIGLTFKTESYEHMAEEYIALYNRAAASSGLADGIYELLTELYASGFEMFILSACEEKLLHEYTDRLGITRLMKKIYGTGDNLAHGKQDAAKRLTTENTLIRPILIGDTAYDADMARHLGASFIAVSWGHHDKERFKSSGCELVDTTAQLRSRILSNE